MKAIKLSVSVVLCLFVGFLGSLVTTPAIGSWYAGIAKPAFNPPNRVFGPVWTTLFVLMGIALYLVWAKKGEKGFAITLFIVQLGLNLLWSVFFFGLGMPLLAFADIIVLWSAILLTMLAFHKVSKPAAYLLIPYIVWVSFASVLNLAIVILN
jgi:tryptophan-rich sensory protein